jgi:hypothetical protein
LAAQVVKDAVDASQVVGGGLGSRSGGLGSCGGGLCGGLCGLVGIGT